MSKLNPEEIKRIANLARIGIDETEAEQLSTEVSSILTFVEQLQRVPTKNTDETSQVSGLKNVVREDIAVPCKIAPKDLLAAAAETQDNMIKVPRIIQNG